MSPEQKTVIQETWRQVAPIADQAATLFYDRLFATDPELRALFAGAAMTRQRQRLIQALGTVVDGLDSVDDIVPHLQALGRRHAGYGVQEGHYDAVGAALLWALERGLGDGWTVEAKTAWSAAYGLVADVMQQATRDAHVRATTACQATMPA